MKVDGRDRAAYYFWLVICCFFVIAILMQSSIFCNTDARWLLHATAKFISGGKYYHDFFETNPPMILYLNIPLVLLEKFLRLPFGFIFRAYVFLLAVFSLAICSVLLKKIYHDRPKWMLRIFICALTYVFVILPAHTFGEREHLALLLTVPYFFLVVLRGSNYKISIKLAVLIGVLAGCGFAIKPYFVIPFGLVELYLMFGNKKLFSWLRLETLIIIGILILYLAAIFIFTPEYITQVVPLAWQFYFSAVGKPYIYVFSSIWMIFFLLSSGCFVLFYELVEQQKFVVIMFLASAGFICAYVLQHTMWFYHALPSYAFSLLLLVQLLQEIIFKPIGTIIRYKRIKIFILVLMIVIFGLFVPFEVFYTIFSSNTSPKVERVIGFIQHNTPNHKVYFFTTSLDLTHRIIDKAGAQSVSRFPSQLLLPGMLKQLDLAKTTEQKNTINRYKQQIINAVVEDLSLYKPDLIIITDAKHDSSLSSYNFTYIKFFSQDLRFRKIFTSYSKVYKMGSLTFYRRGKLDVEHIKQ
ncbi:MAG: hypothetical protein PVI75_06740 [Gammaproteobacteria bacterium]